MSKADNYNVGKEEEYQKEKSFLKVLIARNLEVRKLK